MVKITQNTRQLGQVNIQSKMNCTTKKISEHRLEITLGGFGILAALSTVDAVTQKNLFLSQAGEIFFSVLLVMVLVSRLKSQSPLKNVAGVLISTGYLLYAIIATAYFFASQPQPLIVPLTAILGLSTSSLLGIISWFKHGRLDNRHLSQVGKIISEGFNKTGGLLYATAVACTLITLLFMMGACFLLLTSNPEDLWFHEITRTKAIAGSTPVGFSMSFIFMAFFSGIGPLTADMESE